MSRRELEIGEATVWVDTDAVALTLNVGTLAAFALAGYLLGRRRSR